MDTWAFRGLQHPIDIPARVVARYRSIAGAAGAVASGLGIAPLPAMYFEDPLLKEVLVSVLPEYPLQQCTMYALYASGRVVPPKVRAFIDFVIEWTRKSGDPGAPC
jgi:DNA-binding transcriptional LysR family regulator